MAILASCTSQPTPSPIAPVTGLPQGSNNLPWWNDTVFYEIFVRSFYDSNGDGIGDLNGLISKLDYLNDGDPDTTDDLGVTGLWLMPIHPAVSYHGYDVTDYYAINPDYGTMDDFKRLLDEAHRAAAYASSSTLCSTTPPASTPGSRLPRILAPNITTGISGLIPEHPQRLVCIARRFLFRDVLQRACPI